MATARVRLGARIRALRRREGMTQVQLAEKLGISASYLNLIEHDRRPLSATLLIRLAQLFQLDVKSFGADDEGNLVNDLLEVFSDGVFEGHELSSSEVRELAASQPSIARAVVTLFDAYRRARDSATSLAARLSDGDLATAPEHAHLPPEEVTDFIQRRMNYFPELEEAADRLRRDARLDESGPEIFGGLVSHLSRVFGVTVRIEKVGAMQGMLRRYDGERRLLQLSEVLRGSSRNFQLALQIGVLSEGSLLTEIARDTVLTTDESVALCRVSMANYFAGAVLMPYVSFLESARSERYDIDLLAHRFRGSFEQVCHRLTTLRRPGLEGVPFHFVRVDIAGNISKRFAGSGIRIARFSAACARWNVHSAFLTPGMLRVQLSRMPDGTTFFEVARTLAKDSHGYHSTQAVQAVGIGCPVSHAKDLVYADGFDLDDPKAAVPVGISCRLCERTDCEQRAFPALQHRLQIDENSRAVSFYAPAAH